MHNVTISVGEQEPFVVDLTIIPVPGFKIFAYHPGPVANKAVLTFTPRGSSYMAGRYVVVQIPRSILTMCEVQVMGTRGNDNVFEETSTKI